MWGRYRDAVAYRWELWSMAELNPERMAAQKAELDGVETDTPPESLEKVAAFLLTDPTLQERPVADVIPLRKAPQ